MKKMLLFLFALGLLVYACDTEQRFHQVSVQNGTGSGEYELGANVTIEADAPPADRAFFAWEGDVAFLNAVNAPVATFKMPPQDVTFTATFKDLPRYLLMVTGGSGSGEYLENTQVAIAAQAPDSDQLFVNWIGDTSYVDDPAAAATNVRMPAQAIAVEAIFESVAGLISFQGDVKPIFNFRCATAACHAGNNEENVYLTYAQIAADTALIREVIYSNRMPPAAPMTPEEEDIIFTWIDQGAPNN